MLGERTDRNQRNERKEVGGRFRLVRYFRSFRSLIRSVAGMPDYDAYLEHLRRHHPEAPVPTPRAFYEQYLAHRYGDTPTRCC